MDKTINDFIEELKSLKPSLRELPIVIIAPNGFLFEPKVKVLRAENESMFDEPKQMVITYD